MVQLPFTISWMLRLLNLSEYEFRHCIYWIEYVVRSAKVNQQISQLFRFWIFSTLEWISIALEKCRTYTVESDANREFISDNSNNSNNKNHEVNGLNALLKYLFVESGRLLYNTTNPIEFLVRFRQTETKKNYDENGMVWSNFVGNVLLLLMPIELILNGVWACLWVCVRVIHFRNKKKREWLLRALKHIINYNKSIFRQKDFFLN